MVVQVRSGLVNLMRDLKKLRHTFLEWPLIRSYAFFHALTFLEFLIFWQPQYINHYLKEELYKHDLASDLRIYLM